MRYYIYNPDTLLVLFATEEMDFQPDNSIEFTSCDFKKPMVDQHPNPTQLVEGFSTEEIAHELTMQAIENEYQLYQQRKEDGINAYLKISAELRLAKLGGAISNEAHRAIETALEPVRAEVVLGQWIGAQEKLEDLGSSIIGEDMFNDLMNRITSYISNNY